MEDTYALIAGPPGKRVKMTVERDGKRFDVVMTLAPLTTVPNGIRTLYDYNR
jgi:hypothetical protein